MQKIFLYGIALLLFSSCGGGDKQGEQKSAPTADQPKTKNPAQGEVNITFKADGEAVNTAGWIVQRFVWDDKTPAPWLNIVSNMHMNKKTINVNLNGSVSGNYELSETGMMKNSHGMYHPDYSNLFDAYSFVSGNFNITLVDTVNGIINGSFSGVVKNTDGKSINITDGELKNVKLKQGVMNMTAEAEKLVQ